MSVLRPILGILLLLLSCSSEREGSVSEERGVDSGRIKVVTSTPDLESIVEEIGGNRVRVVSLSRGDQNLHYVQPSPDRIKELADAELFFFIGLGLDNWALELLKASQNEKIQPNTDGYIDVSKSAIRTLEKPKLASSLERNLHAYGNPHYWLDPENGKEMAKYICLVLRRVRPADSDYFERRLRDFLRRLDAAIALWRRKALRLKGVRVLTYHKSWTYLFRFLGVVEVGTIEPRPGIEPPPSYLAELMERVRKEDVRLILAEPYYPQRTPKMLASQTDAEYLVVATSVGGIKEAKDYISLIECLIETLLNAVRRG